ncbi:FMN-binding negative transcriptional regulator [Actinopolymorpha rutila]|uniref:Uncharacterized protein n=1 Tax=Actinopolymorpha rutila TaxID=446787 RepID=A0A852ZR55_9ACTN|nr:FMN-binding negative transcriptional regulator [Actinopolymorpha rutila]NYH91510.1 hypothetical protein [Actinopolymorpha rutila]
MVETGAEPETAEPEHETAEPAHETTPAPAGRWFDAPVLSGDHVRLEPMSHSHAEGLAAAADDQVFEHLRITRVPRTREEGEAFVRAVLAQRDKRVLLPWTQLDAVTGEVAGTTSYYEIELGVPTSFYATVQLACNVRVVDDPDEKAAVLNRQLGHFEPGSGRAPVPTEADRRLLSGLRALELTVTGVRAKFKYAGNKQDAHRREIAAGLAARGGPSDNRARAHLLRGLEKSAEP